MVKLVLREIRSHFARWLSILAIIALGVGFLAGLMETAPAMLETMRSYVRDSALYDWRAVLPGGFDETLVETAANVRGVRAAEGAMQVDALTDSAIGIYEVFHVHSLTSGVNRVTLRAGRMPQRADECLADSRSFTAADIGTTVRLSEKNEAETVERFAYREYTVVGVAASPLYINYERGSTPLGCGTARSFLYIPRDGFRLERDTDLYLTLETDAPAYSDAYDRILRITQQRLLRFASEHLSETNGAYVLNRKSNIGYATYENDANIVAGIARVFPLFFFLVAALVCVTTMTRTVDEQRTQIGVLRALGFGTGRIVATYLLYAGSASVLGCVSGFFLGSASIPRVIWAAYSGMYQQGKLQSSPDYPLGAALTVAFTATACLAAYLVFRWEDRDAPAQLMRPRPPRSGRHLLSEKLPQLGKRLSPSGKVTLRTLPSAWGRGLMTVVGVAGCTALLLAGYGIRDSVGGIVEMQFGEVALYDYLITVADEEDAEALRDLSEGPERLLSRCSTLYQGGMDIVDDETFKSATILVSDEGALDGLVEFRHDGVPLPFPRVGEALVCSKVADLFSLKAGDSLTLRGEDGQYLELTVSGVFDNYFYNYILLSTDTFAEQLGYVPEMHTVLACAAEGVDVRQTGAALLGCDGVLSVVLMEDFAGRVDKTMKGLSAIVWLVIVCSGALAFIVVYDLTDISIIERFREIATVKVLGFYPRETAAYVFRENVILAVLGTLLGLPMGKLLHAFVIRNVKIDMIYFRLRILPVSYVCAVAITFLFVAIVDGFMYLRLERIHMAEALKSAE